MNYYERALLPPKNITSIGGKSDEISCTDKAKIETAKLF
jgi:hypothetical protein